MNNNNQIMVKDNNNKDNNKPIKSNNSWRIPIEAIIDLKSKNLSNSEIAKLLGCCPSNITQRLKDVDITKQYTDNRAMVFAYHQQRILKSIVPSDLKKANLRDKVISAGVLFDKERLERDLSTQNVALHSIVEKIEKEELKNSTPQDVVVCDSGSQVKNSSDLANDSNYTMLQDKDNKG